MIGDREFHGWVRRAAGDRHAVTMPRVAATLSTVEVTAAGSATNAPLVPRVTGTIQDVATAEVRQSIDPRGTRNEQ